MKDGKQHRKPKEQPEWCTFPQKSWLGDYSQYVQMPNNKKTKVRCPYCNKRLQLTKRGVSCYDPGCDHWRVPPHKIK